MQKKTKNIAFYSKVDHTIHRHGYRHSILLVVFFAPLDAVSNFESSLQHLKK